MEPDQGIALARHLNYIVAFNEWSTEFFFNAGNASGSVLDPVEGIAIRYGCANGKTVWSGENTIIWLAQGRSGGKSVMMFEGNDLKTISKETSLNTKDGDNHGEDIHRKRRRRSNRRGSSGNRRRTGRS